jgi:uncharacterized membrane protein HdeD (DUF308 family)
MARRRYKSDTELLVLLIGLLLLVIGALYSVSKFEDEEWTSGLIGIVVAAVGYIIIRNR